MVRGSVALLLCLLPWESGQFIPDSPELYYPDLSCNRTVRCGFENSVCIDKKCECLDGYEFYMEEDIPYCRMCPVAHQTCESCCYPKNSTQCHNKVCKCLDNNDSYACSILFERDQFKLATEIALGSALVMAIMSLVVLIWKTCLRRRHLGAPRERNDSAASLTSVQLLVAERMRNRPPGYNDRRHIRIEKPPPYEEALRQAVHHAVLEVLEERGSSGLRIASTIVPPAAEDTEEGAASGGLVNPSFVNTEEGGDKTMEVSGGTAELHM